MVVVELVRHDLHDAFKHQLVLLVNLVLPFFEVFEPVLVGSKPFLHVRDLVGVLVARLVRVAPELDDRAASAGERGNAAAYADEYEPKGLQLCELLHQYPLSWLLVQ